MVDRLLEFQKHGLRSWKEKTLASSYGSISLLILVIFCLNGCLGRDSSDSPEVPSPERTPEEELESFETEAGLRIELVAAEPMVQDPVVCTFDEDGRLWVVEMRSYMPDMEGEGEREPIGRVSVLEDTDEDGMMDRSTIYLDSLIMPRAL